MQQKKTSTVCVFFYIYIIYIKNIYIYTHMSMVVGWYEILKRRRRVKKEKRIQKKKRKVTKPCQIQMRRMKTKTNKKKTRIFKFDKLLIIK